MESAPRAYRLKASNAAPPISTFPGAIPWFVDIGAGKGELCTLFATLPHVQRVVAIEPNNMEMATLRANLIHNNIDLSRVETLTKFVGTKVDTEYVEVDQLGLSDVLRGLIKIDVDGFEFDVLKSGTQLFSEGKSDILVETHSPELERDCIEWLKTRGYTCNIIKNAWWRIMIPEQRPLPHNRWLFATRAARLTSPSLSPANCPPQSNSIKGRVLYRELRATNPRPFLSRKWAGAEE